MDLNEIVEQGQNYLVRSEAVRMAIRAAPLSTRALIEAGQQALRKHSDAMAGVDIDTAEAIVAAMAGAIKAAERKAPCGAHLGDALVAIEDVLVSLRLNRLEEEEAAMEHEPSERLSGAQLGLSPV